MDVRFGNNGIMDVVLERSELILSIQQRAWLMGKSASDKERYSEKQGKWLEDIFHGNDEDSSRIEVPTRWMGLAFVTAAAKFSDLALKVTEDKVYDELYREREDYVLTIKQPSGLTEYQGRLIADMLFEFIVLYVLYKWCSEVAVEFAEGLSVELKDAENTIKQAARMGSRVCERPYFPF